MVFVKVRETYDLKTVQNKMTVIAIHTPKPDIIKRNFPGLLMQCKTYRPYSCDVRVACASLMPLDPLGVGTDVGDVAPEDVFNPILYKAMSNLGMSQMEARILSAGLAASAFAASDIDGSTSAVDVDTVTPAVDEFPIYYGLLSNAHGWKHANPQAGLQMTDLRPLVYEVLYNFADQRTFGTIGGNLGVPDDASIGVDNLTPSGIRGNAKPMPMINCTSFTGGGDGSGISPVGFSSPADLPWNAEQDVPWLNVVVGAIIVPPSRLHELYYRMVVEWTLEFSSIRPISEITDWVGLGAVGSSTHYQNYDYSNLKKAVTGSDETILASDSCMVSSNVDVKKVM